MTCLFTRNVLATTSIDSTTTLSINVGLANDDENHAHESSGSQDAQALPTQTEPLRGRQCEVDTILEKLGRPQDVEKIATQSGATTREALLHALREEVQHIKWRLGMKKGSFDAWSGRLRARQIQRKGSTTLKLKALAHRRSRSLDELMEPTALARDLERSEAIVGDSSLRQRFLLDANRSFMVPFAEVRHKSGDLDNTDFDAAKHTEPHGRNSRSLPRPQLVRSASAA